MCAVRRNGSLSILQDLRGWLGKAQNPSIAFSAAREQPSPQISTTPSYFQDSCQTSPSFATAHCFNCLQRARDVGATAMASSR